MLDRYNSDVIVQETESGVVEVAAIDPITSMQSIVKPDLGEVATQIQAKLNTIIKGL